MSDKPNILFVMSDQMRASAMKCTGNDDVYTPNFDQMSQHGTRFDHVYTNNPICTPSRACLLSGQHSVSTGVVTNDLPLSTEIPTIGNITNERGYDNGYIGKWHLDGVPRDKWTPPGPRRQGFDEYWAVYNCTHDYFNPKYYTDSPTLIEEDGYEPEIQTDLAIDFINNHAGRDNPFCLFVSWGPPHDPYELVPEQYQDKYDPVELELRPNVEPLDPRRCTLLAPPVKHWGTSETFETGERYTYDDPREGLKDYYAAITALDDQFGRLIEALDEAEELKDTIVVYTSDHGDNLWSHGQNQKGLPYEESINIPFLIRWPGEVPAGAVNETLLSTVDVTPTLLGLANLDQPDCMDGFDLSEAMRSGEISHRPPVFMMGSNWRALRDERYTFARFVDGLTGHEHISCGDWLLFDNERDPYQLQNHVYDGEYADVRDQLSDELEQRLEQLNDPFGPMSDLIYEVDMVEEWNAQVEWFLDAHDEYEHEIGYLEPKKERDSE